jgi:hypothetical protein
MRRLLAALIVLTLVPAVAFARFEKLINDVDGMFERMTGYVVSVDGDSVYTDFGRDKGIFKGMTMKVFRENEPIVHPITKQVLGNKKIYIGDLKVSDVFDNYSTAVMTKQQRAVKTGDIIAVNPPIEVAIKTVKLPERLDLLLKEELGNAKNIIMKDGARLQLTFTQKEEGGIAYTVVDKPTDTTLYSKYFSDQDLNVGRGVDATKDIFRSETIDETYKSMAVGYAKGGDRLYIAAATRKKVDFYLFEGNKFKLEGSIDGDFQNIQHVELADLDADGTEEVFVTQMIDETFVRSSIYEFSNGSFKKVKTDIPYIIRTLYSAGEKKAVAQRIAADGNYLGMVNEFVYVNGEYERGKAISSSRDVNIYGFGYADFDNDGKQDVLHIGDDYKLKVYKGSSAKYTSIEEFGRTPYFFRLQHEVKGGAIETDGATEDSDEHDPFVVEKRKKYIKGRVFVNSDNNIYVVQNTKKYKMLERMQIFGASQFSVFAWDGRKLRSMWQSEIFHPVIVDYYMYEQFGRTYLFLLRNFSDGVLSGDKSEFIYIETK